MLRHLDLSRLALAHLLVGGLVACGSAAPVDVGTDIAIPEPIVTPVDAEPETEAPGQMTPGPGEFDGLVDSGFDRGDVSPYCHTAFEACGGLLAGRWVVEDNCNPVVEDREQLLTWGTNRMSLNENACFDAIQRLTWDWSGEMRFKDGIAMDDRERAQTVDMQLTSSCLSASFGTERADSVSPDVCDDMQDAFTTCALAGGVCMCTNRSTSNGLASGIYAVLGVSVRISQVPAARYEYCVDGDHLLWREKDGAQRQVVLKRTEAAAPGETDPIEIPR